jgi:putative hydrolase of the HAD superfamily
MQRQVEAILVDVGGVLLVPHQEPVWAALEEAGIRAQPGLAERAHYVGIRALDEARGTGEEREQYLRAFVQTIQVPDDLVQEAVQLLHPVWAGRAVDLWRQPVPGSREGLLRLSETGVKLAIVSNSDGTAEEQLLTHGICQVGVGSGVPVLAIVDSFIFGAAKPDPSIFHHAAARLGVEPGQALHVGDSVRYDVEGARAAGLHPVHFDPFGLCARLDGHDHVTRLAEIEQYTRGNDQERA